MNDIKFVTKDSGNREQFKSGMRRDDCEGKIDYTLVDKSMLKRWEELMNRGAEKYGKRNWEKANSREELERFISSAFRHFMQWQEELELNKNEIEEPEDHASAVFFNIAAAEMVAKKLKNQNNQIFG